MEGDLPEPLEPAANQVPTTITRRDLLRSAAAAGALAVARPWGALAETLAAPAGIPAARRVSRLFRGVRLLHCDMHNHSLLSDGDGDPERAFASMRRAGLDVAALTDHSTIAWGSSFNPCSDGCGGGEAIAGIDEGKWRRLRALADRANRDGDFIAIRGFEWSSPSQGHLNVWLSEKWMDPLHTGGATTGEGGAAFFHEEGAPIPREMVPLYDEAMRALPTTGTSMLGFYNWLSSDPDRPGLGGGADGLASFNHPGREPGRFGYFRYHPAAARRIVAMEIFNRDDDYLFRGLDNGEASPLTQCLNAGWRVGLSGVTDEHGTKWGFEEGKGRMGLWVTRWSREGVRRAMAARRFFATRLPGLRVDASANRVPMGGVVRHRAGAVSFRLDIDRGRAWWGKALRVQVLRPGGTLPEVAANVRVRVPRPGQEPISFRVPLRLDDGEWVVLRISDPSERADERAVAPFTGFGNAVAYVSPWWLRP